MGAPFDIDRIRREFPVADTWIYLDHAALSPISLRASRAAEAYLAGIARCGDARYGEWLDHIEEVRKQCGELVGARSDEISFLPNTTAGMNEIDVVLSRLAEI